MRAEEYQDAPSNEAILKTQRRLREKTSIRKVKVIPNPKYQRNGTKAYVRTLVRYQFQPTKPGPYYKYFDQEPKTGILAALWSALSFDKKGDKKPGYVPASDFEYDAAYLCEVLIGSNQQKVMLDFDTGSSDLWVNPRAFNPSQSKTWTLKQGKSWTIQYGDGSHASGFVGTDNISVGGLLIRNQAIEVAETLSPELAQSGMDGLLGLAFRKLNSVSNHGMPDPQNTPMENMMSQGDVPKDAQVFTCALYSVRDGDDNSESKESFYTFGFIDSDLVKSSGQDITWIDIETRRGFWEFSSPTVSINGHTIKRSNNYAIADTGTTLALMSDEVCEALYKAIKGATYSNKYMGWVVPTSVTLDDLPEFKIGVGRNEFVIQKEDLLYGLADEKLWYGGVQSRGKNSFDILGDTFLKSVYAIFDQGHKRFGLVPKIEPTQNITPPQPVQKRK